MPKESLPDWANNPTAIRLLEAYQRIVSGHPQRVKKGARITQALVATEAGYQRSIIKPAQYPDLCHLIGQNAGSQKRATTSAQKLAQKSTANRKERERNSDLKEQYDVLLSQYISLGTLYLELSTRAQENGQQRDDDKVVALRK